MYCLSGGPSPPLFHMQAPCGLVEGVLGQPLCMGEDRAAAQEGPRSCAVTLGTDGPLQCWHQALPASG